MSNILGPLTEKNPLEILEDRDSARHEIAIVGIYTADCAFFESEEGVVGRDALNAKVERILRDAPGLVFRVAESTQVNHYLGRLQWSFGPIGAPPVITSLDVAWKRDAI